MNWRESLSLTWELFRRLREKQSGQMCSNFPLSKPKAEAALDKYMHYWGQRANLINSWGPSWATLPNSSMEHNVVSQRDVQVETGMLITELSRQGTTRSRLEVEWLTDQWSRCRNERDSGFCSQWKLSRGQPGLDQVEGDTRLSWFMQTKAIETQAETSSQGAWPQRPRWADSPNFPLLPQGFHCHSIAVWLWTPRLGRNRGRAQPPVRWASIIFLNCWIGMNLTWIGYSVLLKFYFPCQPSYESLSGSPN